VGGGSLAALALGAQPLDLEAVEARPEAVFEAHLALPFVEVGIVELDDPPAPGAHHVVVALTGGDPLVDVVLTPETGDRKSVV
jgi:hypothetical protein